MVRLWKNFKLLTICTQVFGISAFATGPAPVGHVTTVIGLALIRPASGIPGKDRLNGALKPGAEVYEGDVINTSSNGSVKILLADNTVMDLGPGSLMHMDSLKNLGSANREVKVEMAYGTARTSVTEKLGPKGKFVIRTKSATMGVRGTEFIVKSQFEGLGPTSAAASTSAPGGKTEVMVVQGKVEVEAKSASPAKRSPSQSTSPSTPHSAKVTLGAGEGISMSANAPKAEAPTTFTPAQMESAVTSTKVEDTTFKSAIQDQPGSGGGSLGAAAESVIHQEFVQQASGTSQAAPSLGNAPIFSGPVGQSNPLASPVVNMTAGGLRRVRVMVIR